ncbi:MAG: Na+/H+ antiporter subunit G, partial [Myxococcaceae bacterium]
MRTWLAGGLMLSGALFMALAALGLARLPDLFCRMQAAAKSGT